MFSVSVTVTRSRFTSILISGPDRSKQLLVSVKYQCLHLVSVCSYSELFDVVLLGAPKTRLDLPGKSIVLFVFIVCHVDLI